MGNNELVPNADSGSTKLYEAVVEDFSEVGVKESDTFSRSTRRGAILLSLADPRQIYSFDGVGEDIFIYSNEANKDKYGLVGMENILEIPAEEVANNYFSFESVGSENAADAESRLELFDYELNSNIAQALERVPADPTVAVTEDLFPEDYEIEPWADIGLVEEDSPSNYERASASFYWLNPRQEIL